MLILMNLELVKPNKQRMKTRPVRILLLTMMTSVILLSCKTDAVTPPTPTVPSTALSATTILGSWKVTAAEGTEWGKDTPTGTAAITTPRANDPSTIDVVLTFVGTDVTGTKGSSSSSFAYTLDVANSTILMGPDGNTGIGFYTIKDFVGGASMKMEQRIPIAADFRDTPSEG